jgi:hypothetical protein
MLLLVVLLIAAPRYSVEGFPQRAIPAICQVLETNQIPFVKRGERCIPVDQESAQRILARNPPMSVVSKTIPLELIPLISIILNINYIGAG